MNEGRADTYKLLGRLFACSPAVTQLLVTPMTLVQTKITVGWIAIHSLWSLGNELKSLYYPSTFHLIKYLPKISHFIRLSCNSG